MMSIFRDGVTLISEKSPQYVPIALQLEEKNWQFGREFDELERGPYNKR